MKSAAAEVVRAETRLSVVINTLLSAAFFWLVFGLVPMPLSTAIPDNLALDFVPQSLAVGFFAALVPVLIFNNKRRNGRIDGLDTHAAPAKVTLFRAVGFAAVAGAVGALIAFALPLATAQIGYFAALAMKGFYGGLLAFFVTPHALRLALTGEKT